MAKNTKAEMLRFGIIQDIETPFKQRMKEINDYYAERKSFYKERIGYYEQKGRDDRVQEYEQRWKDVSQRIDERLASAEASYEKKLAKQEERIDSPIYQRRLSEAQLKETREKAAAAQEKMRQEQEVMQREEGERQAARFRARGGGRAGARPMLATARMAPQQTMAPGQTLGTFMPK